VTIEPSARLRFIEVATACESEFRLDVDGVDDVVAAAAAATIAPQRRTSALSSAKAESTRKRSSDTRARRASRERARSAAAVIAASLGFDAIKYLKRKRVWEARVVREGCPVRFGLFPTRQLAVEALAEEKRRARELIGWSARGALVHPAAHPAVCASYESEVIAVPRSSATRFRIALRARDGATRVGLAALRFFGSDAECA
jgi:hypothetical protein